MKKILAAALALMMTATVLASCGEKKEESSKPKEETSSAAVEESAAPEESTEAGEGEEEAAEPKPLSEMPAALVNHENASFKFTTDMKIEDIVNPMNGSNYTDDESQVKMTIEELEGIPMLRVQTLDMDRRGENYKVPKIKINVTKLFEGKSDLLPKIFSVKMDVVTKAVGTIANDEGTECLVPSFFGGKFVTQPWSEAEQTQTWNELLEFSFSEWTSEWAYYELAIRPGIKETAKFVDTDKEQFLGLMKWSIPNQADFYIANITFLDENGEVLACTYGA